MNPVNRKVLPVKGPQSWDMLVDSQLLGGGVELVHSAVDCVITAVLGIGHHQVVLAIDLKVFPVDCKNVWYGDGAGDRELPCCCVDSI